MKFLVDNQLPVALARSLSGAPVALVWIRLGNCRKAVLLASVAKTWPRVCACLRADERIVEIR